MPIDHVVLYKLRADRPQERDALIARARRELAAIPGVQDVRVGPNLSPRSAEWTHGMTVRIRDRAALEHYYACDEHLRLARDAAPMMDASAAKPVHFSVDVLVSSSGTPGDGMRWLGLGALVALAGGVGFALGRRW